MHEFDYSVIHPSWRDTIQRGLKKLDPSYLRTLQQSDAWLPGPAKIFSAFSLPLDQVQYVLFGESPYPRKVSANGYAFWDAAVTDLWAPTGLAKPVNRATSLRNMIKMMLVADGKLTADDTSQPTIAQLDKSAYVQTNHDFFNNFLQRGFLLLNASPVLQPTQKPHLDAKAWHPFINEVLGCIKAHRPDTEIILFGKIAQAIDPMLVDSELPTLRAEHPYNLSFIENTEVLRFFGELRLLDRAPL